MNRIRSQSLKRVISLSAGFAAAIAVVLLFAAADSTGQAARTTTRGDELSADEANARRDRVTKMSALERDRLARQYEQFLAMPASEQDELRRLRREIERDEQSNGNLQSVLVNYQAWLATLTPWQRAEIRSERDSERRLALAVRFKQEQAEEVEVPQPGPPGDRKPPQRAARHFDIRLSKDDYNTALGIIEDSLNLPAQKREELNTLSPAHRHVRVILAAIDDAHDGPSRTRMRRWLSDDVINRIVDSIKDPRVRDRLRSDELSPDMRRGLLGMRLRDGLDREVGNELESRMPPRRELIEFFRSLEKDQESELFKSGAGKDLNRLRMSYLLKKQDPLALDYIELRKRIAPLAMRRRPPDQGPPPFRGERPPGPRDGRLQRREPGEQPPEKDRRPRGKGAPLEAPGDN